MSKKNNLGKVALIGGGIALAAYSVSALSNNSSSSNPFDSFFSSGGGSGAFNEGAGIGDSAEKQSIGQANQEIAGLENSIKKLQAAKVNNFTIRETRGGGRSIRTVVTSDSDALDSAIRSGSLTKKEVNQAVIVDKGGAARGVRDFDRNQSFSADGGQSNLDGSVTINKRPVLKKEMSEAK